LNGFYRFTSVCPFSVQPNNVLLRFLFQKTKIRFTCSFDYYNFSNLTQLPEIAACGPGPSAELSHAQGHVVGECGLGPGHRRQCAPHRGHPEKTHVRNAMALYAGYPLLALARRTRHSSGAPTVEQAAEQLQQELKIYPGVNGLFRAVMACEAQLLRFTNFPAGGSIAVVARKI